MTTIPKIFLGRNYTKIAQDLLDASKNIDLTKWPVTVGGKDGLLEEICAEAGLQPEELQKRIELATLKAIELGESTKNDLDKYRESLRIGKHPKSDKKFRRMLYERFGETGGCMLSSTTTEEAMQHLEEALVKNNAEILECYLHDQGFIYYWLHDEKNKFRKALAEGNPIPRKKTWAEATGKQPNEVIYTRHGGGWMFLQDFLLGNNIGYRLGGPGFGIQVHPIREIPGRDKRVGAASSIAYYAKRTAHGHFDYPASLDFEIEAQYLATHCPSHKTSEADLLPEHLPYARNFMLQNLETDETIKAQNLDELRDKIKQSIRNEEVESIKISPVMNPFTVQRGNTL